MRHFAFALLAGALVSVWGTAAQTAPPVSEVEVINEPLEVVVVNPPPAIPPPRWQLVGFTSATYTGAMGGHFGVTQKCQIEFPNSRMCSVEEVVATTTVPTGLSGEPWVHKVINAGGGVIFNVNLHLHDENCSGWRSHVRISSSGTAIPIGGQFIESDGTLPLSGPSIGGVPAQYHNCTESHPIACCALVP